MSGHIEYVRHATIYGRVGGDGDLVNLGVIEIGEDDTPADVNRTLASFYRRLATGLDREADKLDIAAHEAWRAGG